LASGARIAAITETPEASRADIERRYRNLRTFAGDLVRAPWFASCGNPHTPDELAAGRRYLEGLGMPAMPIERVVDWTDAAATTQRPDWSQDWWRADDAAAKALHRIAAQLLGETPLLVSLSAVTLAAQNLHANASVAMAGAGLDDPTLSRVAAGAAALACHQMGLAIAAQGGAEHPLALKYRLFAGGRWLLGVMGDRCYLF